MNKRPLLIVFLGYITGIIMELYFEKGIALFVICTFLFAIIIKYVKLRRKWFLKQKQFYIIKRLIKYLKNVLNIKIVCIFIYSFIVGVIYTKYLDYRYENLYLGIKDGNFIGIIQSNPEEREYNTRYKIRVQSINSNNRYKNTNLYLLINKESEELEYGDLITFKGEFIEPQIQRNYGGFDYKEYLKTIKIYGSVRCTDDNIKLCNENKLNIVTLKMNELSNKIKENIYKLFEQKQANLLIGILIGDINKIDEGLKEDFRNSSLLHVLAVSGTHVNYIIMTLVILNTKFKVNRKLSKIVTIIILILFMFLVGFSASVVRAVIMGVTILIAQLFYRKLDIINSISFSALLLLVINPFNIINTGFLLSYGGTVGIVSLSQNFSQIFANRAHEKTLILEKEQYINKFIKSVKEILIITISAQIIIMPIIWRMFNTISLTFFISNLLASPIMGIITIFGFITVFVSFISISIAKILAIPLNIIIKFLIFIADFFGKMKISKIYVITIPVYIIVIYYICVYVINYFLYVKYNNVGTTCDHSRLQTYTRRIIHLLKKNYKKILIYYILTLIIFNIISNLTRKFTIHFIDVGQR